MKVLGFAFYALVVCLAGIGSTVWSSQIEIKWDSRLQFIFFIQNPFSWCQKDSIFKLLLLAVGTRFVKQGTGVKLGSYCLSFFYLKKWLEFLDGIFQKLVRIQYLRIRSVIKIGHPLLYKLQFLVGF